MATVFNDYLKRATRQNHGVDVCPYIWVSIISQFFIPITPRNKATKWSPKQHTEGSTLKTAIILYPKPVQFAAIFRTYCSWATRATL